MLKCIEITTLVLLIYLTAHYIQSKLENEFHSKEKVKEIKSLSSLQLEKYF